MNTEQHSFRKIGLLRSLPLPLIALAVLILGGILPLKAQSPGTNQDFLVIVPHTHWKAQCSRLGKSIWRSGCHIS